MVHDIQDLRNNEKKLEPVEGSPSGTHFVVITLLLLVMFVVIYWAVAHIHELHGPSVGYQTVLHPLISA